MDFVSDEKTPRESWREELPVKAVHPGRRYLARGKLSGEEAKKIASCLTG